MFLNFRSHIEDTKWGKNIFLWIVQAVTEVLNKSHYGNSHLQMRQNPITFAEHSGHTANSVRSISLSRYVSMYYQSEGTSLSKLYSLMSTSFLLQVGRTFIWKQIPLESFDVEFKNCTERYHLFQTLYWYLNTK